MELQLITASRLQSFTACHRLHYYQYELCRKPIIDPVAMRFGTVWHVAMEAWWKWWGGFEGEDADDALGAADNALRKYVAEQPEDVALDEWEMERLSALLFGYHLRWSRCLEGWRVIAVEKQFRAPLINPHTGRKSQTYQLGGKIDALVRDPLNDIWIVEHKCLPADAEVWDNGQHVTVGKLFADKRSPTLLSMDMDEKKLISTKATSPRAAGVRDVYVLSTKHGRRLAASDNHPIFTRRGWVPMASLKISDEIAVPLQTGTAAEFPITDAEIGFLGLMLGDGSFCNMTFTKRDDATRQWFGECVEGMGDQVNERQADLRAPYMRVVNRGTSKALALAKRVSLHDSRSADKHIPTELLSMSDRQTMLLLGALWSTDGCVDVFHENCRGSTQAKVRVAYASRSRELCSGIQRLLLRIGFDSSVTESSILYKKERRPYFTVKLISRSDRRRFLALALEGRVKITKYTKEHLKIALGCIKPGIFFREPTIEGNIRWDTVVSLFIRGREMVYDIEVPIHHTLVVNDIITHNTTTADISPAAEYWQRLRMDRQVSMYFDGAEAVTGEKIAGCIYDVACRPRMRPFMATPVENRKYRKDGTLYANQRDTDEDCDEYRARIDDDITHDPNAYYQRMEVRRLDDELVQHRQDIWLMAKHLHEVRQFGGQGARNPDACHRYGHPCPYFSVCTGQASIDDFAFRTGRAHEELCSG